MAKSKFTKEWADAVNLRNGAKKGNAPKTENKAVKPKSMPIVNVFREIETPFLGKEVIYGKVPSKSNNYKTGKNGFYKSKQVTVFEQEFLMQCTKYRDANISTNFAFYLDVYFRNPASDLDGAFKVVLDMLQKVHAITNDKNCMAIHARKFIDKKTPHIEFEIKILQ